MRFALKLKINKGLYLCGFYLHDQHDDEQCDQDFGK